MEFFLSKNSWGWSCFFFFLLSFSPVRAHMTSPGQWTLALTSSHQIESIVSIEKKDIASYLKWIPSKSEEVPLVLLQEKTEALWLFVRQHVQIYNDASLCKEIKSKLLLNHSSRIYWLQTYQCFGKLNKLLFQNKLLLDDVGGYRHFARIQVAKDVVRTTVFSKAFPQFELQAISASANGVLAYLWEGMIHILMGWDHVLFVLSLLFGLSAFRPLLWTLTGFTLGHSLTLSLSALDVIKLPTQPIEALIALSILWVVLENLWRKGKEKKARFWVASLFGLVHGFGFSSVLKTEVGLQSNALFSSLLSFNVGVELGQCLVVCLFFPLWKFLQKTKWNTLLFWASHSMIAVIAVYWFFQRALGS